MRNGVPKVHFNTRNAHQINLLKCPMGLKILTTHKFSIHCTKRWFVFNGLLRGQNRWVNIGYFLSFLSKHGSKR